MKRIKYYILFIACCLSLSVHGQKQQENFLHILGQYDIANKIAVCKHHRSDDKLSELMTVSSTTPEFVVEVGSYSEEFQFTHSQDTYQTSDSYRPSDWQWDESPNDVFYRFTVEVPMAVFAYTTPEARVYIEQEDLGMDELMPIYGESVESNLFVAILPIGTYYVISEGVTDDNGMISNGEIETTIYATPNRMGYSLGTFTTNTRQTIIGDTRRASTEYGDQYRNEIYYYLDLREYMSLSASLNDLELSEVNLYFLDRGGKEIASSKNGRLEVERLSPEGYFLVVEGKYDDGIFSLDLELTDLYHKLHPDVGNNNYILTRTYTEANEAESRINIGYYDGLGRHSESIFVGASPLGKDIVTRQDYDALGRLSCEWLPRVSEYSNGKYLAPTEFVKVSLGNYDNDSHPYSRTVYENSPLNRVIEQYGPGSDWYNNEKSGKTGYKTNVFGDVMLNVKHYIVGGTRQKPTLSQNGNYATGQLYVTEVKNEDGNISYEFKDKLGQVVLTRQMAGKVTHDTYYVYDDFGKQCFVLPPRMDDEAITQVKLDELAYQYSYDARSRCIAKKLPGCEWIYYIYDKADHLIFSQDGNQRQLGEWSFSIPDILGRVVLTGTCMNTLDYLISPLATSSVKGIWNDATNLMKGYIVLGVNLTNPIVLSVNYYDSYDFLGKNGIPDSTDVAVKYEQEQEQNGFGKRYTGGYKGLLTGTLTTQLTDQISQSSYLYSVMYYAWNGQMVQIKSANHLTGGVEKDFFAYNFEGGIISHKHTHSATGKATQIEVYCYTRDHVGRLLTVTHQLNGGANITLIDNKYDELGRLTSNKRNGHVNLKTDYTYNIRSWMKSVDSPLFRQDLYYTNGVGTPCYSGNISSMSWKTSIDSDIRGYRFEYDPLSRLKNAFYGEGEGLSLSSNHFNEQITGYDKNGNILGLKRYGQTSANGYGLVDNLAIALNGNQLKSVDDSVFGSAFGDNFDFKDRVKQGVEYFYDTNGNLLKDLNKSITDIRYNYLNLPNRIEFEDASFVSYLYDATGKKLRVVHSMEGNTTTTDYCGNVIYENGTPVKLLTEAGYVTLDDSKHHYFIQDHLGNNRVVVDQSGNVEEVNHYYPFGGLLSSSVSNAVQPYKYNGKELDRKNGLDWYDYGARMYDAALGRWHAVDAMSEKYYSWSPYTYCKNNPVLRIDLDGKDDYTINSAGRLFRTPIKGSTTDRLLSLKNDVEPITVSDQRLLKGLYTMQKDNIRKGSLETYNSTVGLEDAAAVFKFGADNTSVEWKLDIYDDEGSKTAIIGTSGQASSVFSDKQKDLNVKGNRVVDLHSHPYNDYAADQDMEVLKIKTGAIYHKDSKTLFFYNNKNSHIKKEDYKINTSDELLKKLEEKFMK